jgi:hypothetical protein
VDKHSLLTNYPRFQYVRVSFSKLVLYIRKINFWFNSEKCSQYMSDNCLSKKYWKVEQLPRHTYDTNLEGNCPIYPSSPESSSDYQTDTETNSDMEFE